MKQVLLIALIVISTTVYAEKWSAIGILTTKVTGQAAEARALELDDFDSQQACLDLVKSESMSKNYIGANNGTNGKLPAVHFNFDADCFRKRAD